MCGQFHREGSLCSSCRSRHGVSPCAYHFPCTDCNEHSSYRGALWYILLEFVPITALYVVVVLFRIRATAAPLVGLVFFSQTVLNVVQGREALYTSLVYSTNRFSLVILQIGLMLCGIWNLDFFRYVIPPFCITPTFRNLYAAALEYVSVIYPISLVILTYFLIELHARNVRVIVWVYRPFHKCCVRVRRVWDIERSVINAFSTFLLLSYTKSITASFKLIMQTSIRDVSNGNAIWTGLGIDPDIMYFGVIHAPFAIIAILVIAVSVFLLVLLALYPTKLFRKVTRCCQCRAMHGLHVFVDTYQGCLKDGTNGTRDYRAVSALYFLFHILYNYVDQTTPLLNGVTLIIFGCVYMLVSVLMGTVKPYKENYMNYSESSLFFLNGVFLMLVYVWLYIQSSGVAVATLLVISFVIPHIIYYAILFFRLTQLQLRR